MKTSYMNRIVYGLLLVFMLIGCAEDERLMFEDETSVYFTTTDSLNYSFAFYTEDVVRDTFYLDCRITGTAIDRDRKINIISDEGSDAKADYHYEIVNPVIPAGRYEDSIAVVVHRKPGLRDSLVTAYLRIVDSEDLLAGYNDIGSGPVYRNKYTRQQFKLTITDQLIKPTNWDSSWLPVFGAYSEVKIRFISNATGYTDWGGSPLPQERNYVIQMAYKALYDYEQANGDLIDENGDPVKFY